MTIQLKTDHINNYTKTNFNDNTLINNKKIKKIKTTETSLSRTITYGFLPDLIIGAVFAVYGRMVFNKDFNPKTPDKKLKPILFLHGVNHNQSGLILGRNYLLFLEKFGQKKLGSFYSMNYAGYMQNGRKDTFEDYADIVFNKFMQIFDQTNQVPTIIAHSMGGIIATLLNKKLNQLGKDRIYRYKDRSKCDVQLSQNEIEKFRKSHIITLGTSFHGSGFANKICFAEKLFTGRESIGPWLDMRTNKVRMEDKSRKDPLTDITLYASEASKSGRILYYNVGSSDDEFVNQGFFITKDPLSRHEVQKISHLGLLCNPYIWHGIYEHLIKKG